jgi:hypothetical protein
MTVIVRDWTGSEIEVGAKVLYGAPDGPDEIKNQTAEVIAISEPDVIYNPATDADDGGYGLTVTIKFNDGDTTEIPATPASSELHAEEVFVANEDIEIIN